VPMSSATREAFFNSLRSTRTRKISVMSQLCHSRRSPLQALFAGICRAKPSTSSLYQRNSRYSPAWMVFTAAVTSTSCCPMGQAPWALRPPPGSAGRAPAPLRPVRG
jgi:hypothetical protein